jgi:hypothetical protein
VDENTGEMPDLFSFGGTVGYRIADFDTIEEAQGFVLKGISEVEANLDV